ncbi:MAG: TonB-dependent receptor, partial [Myxococcota bacterium]
RNGGLDVDFFSFPVLTSVIQPEFIDQHEVFVRSSFLGDRLDVSATAFYYDWKDAQVPGSSPVIDANGGRLFGNVPEAIGYGAEVSAAFWPVPEARIDGANLRANFRGHIDAPMRRLAKPAPSRVAKAAPKGAAGHGPKQVRFRFAGQRGFGEKGRLGGAAEDSPVRRA